jgi:membrane protein
MLTVFMLAKIEITFNRIWNVEEHRDIFKRFVAFWTFITLGTFIITLFSSMTFIFIERYMGMGFSDVEAGQNNVFNWIMFSLNFLVFIIAYYLIPNTKVEPTAAIFAGLISGTLFIISKNIYSIYTDYMVTYRKIYGSLSVIPIFLVWIYLIWLIVLSGAVISYVFQNRNILYYKNKISSADQTIKNLIPSAVLINIYKDFLDEKTDGTEINDLREKIKLPVEEIQKALKILKEKKYITETAERKFVPATDISKIYLSDIYGATYLNKDIKLEKIFKDPEVNIIYNHLNKDIESSLKKIDMEKILSEN